MDPEVMLGDVKDGEFRRLYGVHRGDTARLTTIAPQEATPPDAHEIDLKKLEGKLLVVRGQDQGDWIYSAAVLDVHRGSAPPAAEFVRTLMRSNAIDVGGIKKMPEAKPQQGDASKFTAGVLQETLLDAQLPNGMRVHRITYPSRGHTQWHWHEGEQALLALRGSGVVRQEGQSPVQFDEGETVYVTPGARHWHGATRAHGEFVHLAFTANGATEWMEAVSDDEYAWAVDYLDTNE